MDEREYNKQLIAKYPFLMPYNVWTGKPLEDYNYEFTLLDDMPDGWRIAFGEQMCAEIKQALLDEGGEDLLNKYHIAQIKEKYGSLRWYDTWTTDKIRQIIEKYENLSIETCIHCGRPATKISRVWIAPYCDECASPYNEYDELNI